MGGWGFQGPEVRMEPEVERSHTAAGHRNHLPFYSKCCRGCWQLFFSFYFSCSKTDSLRHAVLWILANARSGALTPRVMKQGIILPLSILTWPICPQLLPSLSICDNPGSLSLPAVLSFTEHHANGVTGYIAFWIQLLVLGTMHLKFIHVG